MKRSKEIKLVILGAAALGGCTDCDNGKLDRSQVAECKRTGSGGHFVYVPNGGYYQSTTSKRPNIYNRSGFGRVGMGFSRGGG